MEPNYTITTHTAVNLTAVHVAEMEKSTSALAL